ncbi:MAG: DNA-directed RNA polymerase [Candidatus Thermoplasmatota archaeon]|jgi:DNA-directed RNA polymerase subunit E'|nr:DNA-directed RNA polymerase [Candidatus Thermoplasmatota archaeon]MCL5874122.1 DNA-directed RNA polymerase [Candidatus Thermoplasmatota archaeon]
MYFIIETNETVRVPPEKLGEEYETTAKTIAVKNVEGKIGVLDRELVRDSNDRKYINLLVLESELDGEGRIVHGDGGVYQEVRMKILAFQPMMQEVVEGDVADVKKFGAFVSLGPLEGLLHVSQVMDDRIEVDEDNKRMTGKDTKRDLKMGDLVRARIVALSLSDSKLEESKIGLTMRQNFLGKFQWLKGEAK